MQTSKFNRNPSSSFGAETYGRNRGSNNDFVGSFCPLKAMIHINSNCDSYAIF
jgi:hypothetical protein